MQASRSYYTTRIHHNAVSASAVAIIRLVELEWLA